MIVCIALLVAEMDPAELGPKLLETSAAHFRRGNDDEGQKALDELVRVRPDLPIPADYPPLFRRLHKRALQRAKEKAKGSIGLPPGALLNGRKLPAGTSRVSEVPAGVHYVTLGREHTRIIVGNEQVDVTFGKPDPEAILLGNSVSFFPETDEAPAPVKTRSIVVAPTPEAAASLPIVPAQQAKVTPIYKQWWLWTAVGAVVLGATAAAVLVATARVGNVSVGATW